MPSRPSRFRRRRAFRSRLTLLTYSTAAATALAAALLIPSRPGRCDPAAPQGGGATAVRSGRAPALPSPARLDFALPGEDGVGFGFLPAQRPGMIGRLETETAAPGGPNWEELILIKDGRPVFQFGFLLGVSSFQGGTVDGRPLNRLRMADVVRAVEAVPEKSDASRLTFRILFKRSDKDVFYEHSGYSPGGFRSPVHFAGSEGGPSRAGAGELDGIEVTMRRGAVETRYEPYELSLISERDSAHELTLFYVAAMRLPTSRRFLIDPNRLRKILMVKRVVPDVNEEASQGGTSQQRFTALAALLNEEMGKWDECLYDALEPETDSKAGIAAFGRTEPQRIFRKVKLPAHELAMVKRYQAMKASGAPAEQVRAYRALVNRVLLDRLMVDHWDKGYLEKSDIVLSGLQAIGYPELDRIPRIVGMTFPSVVPAPTEVLRLKVTPILNSPPKGEPKAEDAEGTPDPDNPFIIRGGTGGPPGGTSRR